VAASLLVFQIGPTLFRVREDRYRQDFLPVLDYIRPAVARGEVLISQAEFSIPLGFPDNVITDPSYGWRRKDRPDLVVVDEAVMDKNTTGARERRPDLYRYLSQDFPAEFKAVFTRGRYTVYGRRPGNKGK
jgi:predicted RNA methylase